MDKDIDVSDDYLLLQAIKDEHGITTKQIALWTGRGASTVYKYCGGEATIPMIIWRVLFDRTKDQRIVQLLTGDTPFMVVELLAGEIALNKPTIKRLLDERQKQINCEALVLDIIADGKIDFKDGKFVRKYKKVFPQLISSLYQTFKAITDAYERALK